MVKMRVALLGALALFVVSGIGASAASASGPFWHANGTRLSGIKQLTLQVKGSAVLKSEIGGTPITITCTASESEGAAIESNGTQGQGQDKGRIKYTSCTTNVTGCTVATPITTNNTKSHLVTYNGAQSKYADLFEPQQGEVFTVIKLSGASCLLIGSFNVKGNVAAELIPKETESQEGLVSFPETPIPVVFLEGVEKKIGLFLGTTAAKFAAAYGAKLAVPTEKFGVFGS